MDASPDFRFAASAAAFGMVLKNSQYRGDVTLPWVLDTATPAAVRTAVDIAPSSSAGAAGYVARGVAHGGGARAVAPLRMRGSPRAEVHVCTDRHAAERWTFSPRDSVRPGREDFERPAHSKADPGTEIQEVAPLKLIVIMPEIGGMSSPVLWNRASVIGKNPTRSNPSWVTQNSRNSRPAAG